MQRYPLPPARPPAATPRRTPPGSGPGCGAPPNSARWPGRSRGARRAPPGRPARPGRRPPTAGCPATGRHAAGPAARLLPEARSARSAEQPVEQRDVRRRTGRPGPRRCRRYGSQPPLRRTTPASRVAATAVVVLGQGADEAGPGRAEAVGAGPVGDGQLPRPNRSAAARDGRPGSTQSSASSSGRAAMTSGTGSAAGLAQPAQAGRLGLEEASRHRPVAGLVTCDRCGRQELREDRRAVVEGQPPGPADRAAADRRLPDALMGQERRQVLRMRRAGTPGPSIPPLSAITVPYPCTGTNATATKCHGHEIRGDRDRLAIQE